MIDFLFKSLAPFGKTRLLVVIDELLKLQGSSVPVLARFSPVEDTLHSLGMLLDSRPGFFFTLVTSLSVTELENAESSSGRPIDFIELPLFDHDSVKASLATIVSEISKNSDRRNFQILISDCCGHARSLQELCKAWDPQKTIDAIQDEVMTGLSRIDSPHAVLAIKADLFALGDKFTFNTTFADDIRSGKFINSLDSLEKKAAVPQVSLLQLRHFSQKNLAHYRLLDVVAHPNYFLDRAGNSIGPQFEDFVIDWELLTHVHFFSHKKSSFAVGRYLRSSENSQYATVDLDPGISPSNSVDFDFLKSLKILFIEKDLEELPSQVKSNILSIDYLPRKLYRPAKNNPGFDYFTFDKSETGETILTCVECRISDPQKETKFSLTDVKSKIEHVKTALRAGNGIQQSVSTVLVFFMSMRDVSNPPGAAFPKSLGHPVGQNRILLQQTMFRAVPSGIGTNNTTIYAFVLDRAKLLELFGPSLFARPQFYADYASKGPQSVVSPKGGE